MKPRLVSGMQPDGKLHIGNFLGALKNWVDLQNQYECFFFIADFHALTAGVSPIDYTEDLVRSYLSAGINPDKCTIFIQSHVPQCAELAWIFNCLTPVSELERMTQYKDKKGKDPSTGLLTYPCLMAADILLYKAMGVPVGDDQNQHVELTRKIARKFNNKFGETFPEPKAVLTPFARLMSLSNPEKKMSKSEPKGCLFLDDSPDIIKHKIQKAVTTPQGAQNLHDLLRAFKGPDKKYEKYSELKKVLSQKIIRELKPIQEKKKYILSSQVKSILKKGADHARKIAQETLKQVKEKIGLIK